MRSSPAGSLVSAGAATALVAGLAVAPPDAVQGDVQRLMHVHVPAAWTARSPAAHTPAGAAR